MTPNAAYRPDIDGLRALAVVAVILYHFEVPAVTGGFTGVDVFFVISGFLIIRIILRELSAGTFTLTNFWARRIRRIIPALVVVLLATAAAAYFLILLPSELSDFGKTLIAQSVFLSNMWFMGQSSYFAAPAETMPLLHTWTLALEEQFYILFPLLALLCYRLISQPNRYVGWIMIALALISFAYSLLLIYTAPAERFAIAGLPQLWGSATNSAAAFYFLVPRLWEFLVGGIIAAFAFSLRHKITAEVTAIGGLGAILVGVFVLTDETVFPGVAVLLPVLGTAAVIVANTEHTTLVGRVLSYPAVVVIGLWSYSLYLWHWPLLVLAGARHHTNEFLSGTEKCFLILATFFLSYLTYQFIETPFRQKRLLAQTKQLYAAGLSSLLVVAAVGWLIVERHGFPERLTPEAQQVAAAMQDENPRRDECFTKATVAAAGERAPCLLGVQDPEDVSFVLWGDSHANAAMPAFDAYGRATDQTGVFFGAGSCAPIPSDPPLSADPECQREVRRAIAFISQNQPEEVFLVSEWKEAYSLADDTNRGYYLHGLLTNTIGLLPKATTVTVLHRLPTYQNMRFRDLLLETELTENELQLWVPREEYLEKHRRFYTRIDLAISRHENARTLDPVKTLCDKTACYLGTPEGLYITDASHLSTYGAYEIILPLLLGRTVGE